MTGETFSIVTCSYQQGRYLEAAIRSVLDQQYANLEYIVVDGGSTDQSIDILRRYDDAITYWHSASDAGQTDALASGLDRATGELMGWLCSDDLLLPGALNAVAAFFDEHPEVDAVYGDALWIGSQGEFLRPKREIEFNRFIFHYDHNYIPQPSMFWRRRLYDNVGGLNRRFNLAMDADLWDRFSQVALIAHLPQYLSCMRYYPEQKTRALRAESSREAEEIRGRSGLARYKAMQPLFRGLARTQRRLLRLASGAYFERVPSRLIDVLSHYRVSGEPFGRTVSWPQTRVSGKLLFAGSKRPLLVPKGDDVFVRDAIRLFVHGNARRAWAATMLKLDRWLPPLQLLPTVKPQQFPLPEVYEELGIAEDSFAIFYGPPGPLRKLTVFSSAADRSLTKIALLPSADAMVRNECKILTLLADKQIGIDSVPRLLSHGQLSSGRRFVRTTVFQAGRYEPRFGAMHRAFLELLYAHRSCAKCWAQSYSYRLLLTRAAAIRNMLHRKDSELIDSALADVAALGGTEPVAECVVHGDFAPWNITVADDRLRVFDWEYAAVRGNPLRDFLHFHLIPDAVSHRIPGSTALNRLGSNAREHLACLAGQLPSLQLVGALMLQYLAETVTFFCAMDGELKTSHPVIEAYIRLLQDRHAWLPTGVSYGEAGNGR